MPERFPIHKRLINLQDPRDVRAVEILETSPTWEEIRRSRHGRKAYGIPSSSRIDVIYHVDLEHCECEDHKFRSNVCAHIRAVRLYVNLLHSHIRRAAVGIERELRAQQKERPLTYF